MVRVFLLSLFALLGAAAMGVDQGRKLAGVAGPILSRLPLRRSGTHHHVQGRRRSRAVAEPARRRRSWLGLASMPLLGSPRPDRDRRARPEASRRLAVLPLDMTDRNVGVLGTGMVGEAIATRLIEVGYDVVDGLP